MANPTADTNVEADIHATNSYVSVAYTVNGRDSAAITRKKSLKF
jgi:hypothetical protein